MNTLLSYVVGITIGILALIPPIDFAIKPPGSWWHWMVLIAGFFGFYTLFLRVNVFLKLIAVYAFFNCFLSMSPYISFTSYISVVFCIYFYILCSKITDYAIVFRFLSCILFFNVFIMTMQIFKADALLNFGRDLSCFGAIGHHMQMASFSVILAAVLLSANRANVIFPFVTSIFCNSVCGFLSAGVGLVALLYTSWHKRFIKGTVAILLAIFVAWGIGTGKFEHNFNKDQGRVKVWVESLKLASKRPLMGYGIGSYQYVFPSLGGIPGIPWKTAHNCWIQLLVEIGLVGIGLVGAFLAVLISRLRRLTRIASSRKQAMTLLAGMAMIAFNMLAHFPTRQIQIVLIIVFFLAYCQRMVERGEQQG